MMNIFVGNLSYQTTQEDLQSVLFAVWSGGTRQYRYRPHDRPSPRLCVRRNDEP